MKLMRPLLLPGVLMVAALVQGCAKDGPPRFAEVHLPSVAAASDGPIMIHAVVLDDLGSDNLSVLIVQVDEEDGDETLIRMELIGDDVFRGKITNTSRKRRLLFYLRATDRADNTTLSPEQAPMELYHVELTAP